MLELTKALQITLATVSVWIVLLHAWPMVRELWRGPGDLLAHYQAMWVLIWFSIAYYFVPVAWAYLALGAVAPVVPGVPPHCRPVFLAGLTAAGTWFIANRNARGPRARARLLAIAVMELILVTVIIAW